MSGPLVLQDGERRLGVRAGALVVERRGEPLESFRPSEIEEVWVFGDATISPAARRLLLHQGIDVVYHARDGRVLGRLSSAEHRAGERRLAQYRATLDGRRRLELARALVQAKLANQRHVLLRYQRGLRRPELADALAYLRASVERAGRVGELDALRGIEGSAARVYFEVLGLGLSNPLFHFDGRNRRPPRDPVNAVLSFLYTLLCQRTGWAARSAGLDPYLGFLHEPGRGREALAFDLAEPYRPLVDRLALGLFNQRQLAPEDFQAPEVDLSRVGLPPEEGGEPEGPPAVHLGPVGRTVVLTAWSRRLRDRLFSPGLGQRRPLAELIREDARALARAVQDPERPFRPFRWR